MGENLYELPKGWVWVNLGDLFDIQGGSQPAKTKFIYEPKEGYTRLLQIRDYGQKEVPTYVPNHLVTKTCNKEDILIARYGASLGRIVTGMEGAYNVALAKVIFEHNLIFNKFVFYLLQTPLFQTPIHMISRSAQNGFNKGEIFPIKLPLSPLPEQYRIVAKIEELFTQLDAGVELLKKVKAKLKRYRQAVLKAAVEGNLTKEWRTAHQGELETASVLLERILKQRREKWEAEQLAKMQAQGKTPKDDSWKLKYKEPVAPDTSDLSELPNGWCWASLEQLSWDSRYGTSEKCDYNFSGSPVFRIPNIVDGSIVLDNLKYAANDYKLNAIEPLTYGDLLIIRTNGSKELIGRAALVTQIYDKPYFFASYLIRFRLISIEILPIWVNKIWNNFRIRTWVETRAATSAGQHNISQTVLNKLPLEVPPLLEQKRIIEEIERIVSIIDKLEKTVDTNIKRAEKLRQSILKQAFTGQLVPQDPNDEPAEKLLERIKAEKASREADKKTQQKTKIKSTQPRKSKKLSTQLELNLDK